MTSGSLQALVRAENGSPVIGAEVSLSGSGVNFRALTNTDGVFRFASFPAGQYKLAVVATGFRSLEESVLVTSGQVRTLELTMSAVPGELGEQVTGLPQRSSPVTVAEPAAGRNIIQPETNTAIDSPPGPREVQVFEPVPDRWSYRFPDDKRKVKTHVYDPFNRNPLKGDVPVLGNRTFLNLSAVSTTFLEGRRLPTPSNVPSANAGSADFFGRSGQFVQTQNFAFTADLSLGDAAFRPVDWRIRITPEINLNYLATKELGIVNADPTAGTARFDTHIGVQEAFAEIKLKDLSDEFDFISARAGIQSFNSDFRGFVFNDQEPGLRLFGNLRSNRYQFNAAAFTMLEKDTNSGLNRFKYRKQQVLVANLYRQDFLVRGYTVQVSFHYDKDDASVEYDKDGFLVRPAPVGSARPHAIRAYYYGLTGDGHIGKLNLNHAFYQVLGTDKFNLIAGRRVDINAQMAAAELSLDRDWLRYRVAFFYASGDGNPRDGTARGFDAIFPNPNFAGGVFSFWNREGIRLTGSGVELVGAGSLNPDLRSGKTEGQANFVNPGLYLFNAGVDAEVTPRLRAFLNLNIVRFARVEPLELVLFQAPIHAGVGADSGLGFTYRPKLSENISITAGTNAFVPFQGFREIYSGRTLLSLFTSVRFRF